MWRSRARGGGARRARKRAGKRLAVAATPRAWRPSCAEHVVVTEPGAAREVNATSEVSGLSRARSGTRLSARWSRRERRRFDSRAREREARRDARRDTALRCRHAAPGWQRNSAAVWPADTAANLLLVREWLLWLLLAAGHPAGGSGGSGGSGGGTALMRAQAHAGDAAESRYTRRTRGVRRAWDRASTRRPDGDRAGGGAECEQLSSRRRSHRALCDRVGAAVGQRCVHRVAAVARCLAEQQLRGARRCRDERRGVRVDGKKRKCDRRKRGVARSERKRRARSHHAQVNQTYGRVPLDTTTTYAARAASAARATAVARSAAPAARPHEQRTGRREVAMRCDRDDRASVQPERVLHLYRKKAR